MKQFVFKKVDAFTDGNSSGNSAGCVYLQEASDITDEEMQKIASELKGFVNEVVYIFKEEDVYLLKYYSSECEVNFCGHGTIAMMYDMIKNSSDLSGKEEIKIRVKDEILTVKNKISEDGSIYIYAPSPRFLDLHLDKADIADALGTDAGSIADEYPAALVNGGLNTLIVPIRGLDRCLDIFPDIESLKLFCLKNNIDIILVFTGETAFSENDYRTRVFAPKFGYLEDPATGSGNSAFGYYLLKESLWDGIKLTIEQSSDRARPNIIRLGSSTLEGKRRIVFGGSAIARIEGKYLLHRKD